MKPGPKSALGPRLQGLALTVHSAQPVLHSRQLSHYTCCLRTAQGAKALKLSLLVDNCAQVPSLNWFKSCQSGCRSTYTEIWETATNSCPPYFTDRRNLARSHGNTYQRSSSSKLTQTSASCLCCLLQGIAWEANTDYQLAQQPTPLLRAPATHLNLPSPPLPSHFQESSTSHHPKTCRHQRTCLEHLKIRGAWRSRNETLYLPFPRTLCLFLPIPLKKVAEINGEQRNKKKPQLWPTPCLLLKGEGTLPKEEEKNVLRHNGSKGQAANRATLYC